MHSSFFEYAKETEELKLEKYKQTKVLKEKKQCAGPQAKTPDD
jgi:hypothetical protein